MGELVATGAPLGTPLGVPVATPVGEPVSWDGGPVGDAVLMGGALGPPVDACLLVMKC